MEEQHQHDHLSQPPLADALGLAGGGAKAEAYLETAARLAQLQIAQLEEEQRFEHFHHFSAVMKAGFEAAVALVLVIALAGAGTMVWLAAHDDGLLIEPFSVPQEMANRGLTGQVVAARLLDRLSQLQDETQSNRAASSYANDWGNDIRVQIPETGVSVSQLYTYLSEWLGHQTHISGEVFRNPDGKLALTARVGSTASPTFTGDEAGLSELMQQAAENVYAATQPYRYGVYLSNHGRIAEAEAAFRKLIATGPVIDKAWAYVGLSSIAVQRGNTEEAIADGRKALQYWPNLPTAWFNIANLESQIQHQQAALEASRKMDAALAHGERSIDAAFAARDKLQNDLTLAGDLGDFQTQHQICQTLIANDPDPSVVENSRVNDLQALASMHDGRAADAAIAALPKTRVPQTLFNRAANFAIAHAALERWDEALAQIEALTPGFALLGPLGAELKTRDFTPAHAWVLAETGRIAEALHEVAATPPDCDLCLDARGRIAALGKRWAAADYWFARQAAHAPDVPGAWSDWGQMLLQKGDTAAAIAKFAIAHKKGPHFADPLELWGEALIKQNRSDLAQAKFAEAGKYAPSWGRLHLKWGEALYWTGQREAANAQFRIAATLELTPRDRDELMAFRR